MAVVSIAHHHPAARAHAVLHGLWAATAVGTLFGIVLLVADAALAWGTIGLFGLSPLAAELAGATGAAACCWSAFRVALSAYRIERGTPPSTRTGEGATCTS